MLTKRNVARWRTRVLFAWVLAVSVTAGCTSTGNNAIVTATGTVIGVEGSQTPTSASPSAVIGYKRAEFAYVPVKVDECAEDDDDCTPAFDTPNVLTELYFKTLLQSQLYQRLAIGEVAVRQPGASIIFAKGADGEIDTAALQAVTINPATAYGCETTCNQLDAFWQTNPDAGSKVNAANGQAIRGCMSANGLDTGAGRLAEFITLGKFIEIRKICVSQLGL